MLQPLLPIFASVSSQAMAEECLVTWGVITGLAVHPDWKEWSLPLLSSAAHGQQLGPIIAEKVPIQYLKA